MNPRFISLNNKMDTMLYNLSENLVEDIIPAHISEMQTLVNTLGVINQHFSDCLAELYQLQTVVNQKLKDKKINDIQRLLLTNSINQKIVKTKAAYTEMVRLNMQNLNFTDFLGSF